MNMNLGVIKMHKADLKSKLTTFAHIFQFIIVRKYMKLEGLLIQKLCNLSAYAAKVDITHYPKSFSNV